MLHKLMSIASKVRVAVNLLSRLYMAPFHNQIKVTLLFTKRLLHILTPSSVLHVQTVIMVISLEQYSNYYSQHGYHELYFEVFTFRYTFILINLKEKINQLTHEQSTGTFEMQFDFT